MQFIKNIYRSLTNRFGTFLTNTVLILLVLIVVVALLRTGKETVEEAVPSTPVTRTVSLYTISEADGTAVRTADGNAFIVRAESGGRVDRVASVGETVARGAVIAQLENSAQRAAVLQAQGAYEAAVAGANQSNITENSASIAYEEAEVQATNAYRSAFTDADDILRNTVDTVFSNPDSKTPGLRIDGQGQTLSVNSARVALETTFDTWGAQVKTIPSGDAYTLLIQSEGYVAELNRLTTTLTNLLADEDAINNEAELLALRASFAGARASLNSILSSLSSARSALVAAESARDQARIGSGNGDVSLANAQVKQALGALESARAALNKTAIKTPVAGTVTGVSISVGDIINVGSDVVFVASDEGMETENTVTVPLTAVKFTPTKAFVFTVEEGKLVAHEVTTGAVTAKDISISGAESLESIVLDVRGLKDGDVVAQ